MPTGRTAQLVERFGTRATQAITEAYRAAIEQAGRLPDMDERLKIVEALMASAELGLTDPSHLRDVALKVARGLESD